MSTADESLDDLAARCRSGEPRAVERVLEVVRPAVVHYLLAQGLSDFDVQDIAQEVCISLHKQLPTWKSQRAGDGPVWAFVFTVARRRMVDRHRSDARDRSTGDGDEGLVALPDAAPGPEELVLSSDGFAELRGHLAHLSAKQRDVLLLRIVVGLDVRETAQALGLAKGSVHVLQHRALTSLRARLAGADLQAVSL